MNVRLPISIDISIRGFLRKVWISRVGVLSDDMLPIFSILKQSGCDYYELIDLYSEHSFSEDGLSLLAKESPPPKTVVSVSGQNIRQSIYRWTPSQYRTDSIKNVVSDIHRRLILNSPCMIAYHNNRNPRNKQTVHDNYILLISKDKSYFIDVSRKSTVEFQRE